MVKIEYIIKRNSAKVPYDKKKIESVVNKSMKAVGFGTQSQAKKVTNDVHEKLLEFKSKDAEFIPTVEGVQDLVEEALMKNDLYQVAKAYILYREERNRKRQRNIFEKRLNLKPYEYPELVEYVDSIRFSYWIHTEFNFTGDVQDFKTQVTKSERNVLKNALLAISQIEVSVKTFWAYLYKHFPKPEIGSVGATFAESEVRHHDAYSHLLEILGLNDEFQNLKKIPVIMKRIDYLETSIAHSNSEENRKFAESLLLFSIFIEHVSLFSQFLIIMSFNKYKNLFKGISNAVEATSKEEQIHGNFGIEVIKIIKYENPDWFDKENSLMVQDMCRKAYESESELVDWIYEDGELDFLPTDVVKEFIKNRLNNSLKSLGIEPVFTVDPKLVEQSDWFDDEVIGTKHGDFFVKRSINYSKRTQSITSDDLF